MVLNQIACGRNPSAKGETQGAKTQFVGISGDRFERHRVVVIRLGFCPGQIVRASRTAGLGAGAQGLVDDRLDGARATTAFGAAAKTAIDLLGIARQVFRGRDDAADIVVAKDVAGTNDHENGGPIR